jgi:TrpR-related protein YerC/YecD
MSENIVGQVAPSRDQAELARQLCEVLLTPHSPEEMARLLADLCTPAEVRTLAERWHVARLLEQGNLSYREIHDATGVSTTTIVRVARFLKQEPHQAYRLAIGRLSGSPIGSGQPVLLRKQEPRRERGAGLLLSQEPDVVDHDAGRSTNDA